MLILIWFNPMQTFRELVRKQLVKSTPLIAGYEHLFLSTTDLRRIHRKRNRCKLVGHLWELETMTASNNPTDPSKFELICGRCFPHIHSRRTTQFYNLFTVSHKDHD